MTTDLLRAVLLGSFQLWRLDGDVPLQVIVPAVGGWIDQLAWQPDAAVVWSGQGDAPDTWNAELLPFHLDRIAELARLCGLDVRVEEPPVVVGHV